MTDTTETLRAYYAAWSTGDPDAVAAFFTEDAVFEDRAFEARFEGRDGVRTFAKITYRGVPDFRVEPVRLFVSGDDGAAAWLMSGTHSGALPNLPATGKRFEVQASSIIRLRGGLIAEMLDYWNPVEFQRAVGLLAPA